MYASSLGLAAAILLTAIPLAAPQAAPFYLAHANGGAIHRPGFHAPFEPGGESGGRRTDSPRFRRFFPGSQGIWAPGEDFAEGSDPIAAPFAPPLPPPIFAPSYSYTAIATTAPAAAVSGAPSYARPSGPKIIVVGPTRRSARFARLPIVVYGRAPLARAF